jgi:hypothetical protein
MPCRIAYRTARTRAKVPPVVRSFASTYEPAVGCRIVFAGFVRQPALGALSVRVCCHYSVLIICINIYLQFTIKINYIKKHYDNKVI